MAPLALAEGARRRLGAAPAQPLLPRTCACRRATPGARPLAGRAAGLRPPRLPPARVAFADERESRCSSPVRGPAARRPAPGDASHLPAPIPPPLAWPLAPAAGAGAGGAAAPGSGDAATQAASINAAASPSSSAVVNEFWPHDDDIKEQSRAFRRTVFSFADWEVHRSTGRYKRHMLGMLSSRMVRGLSRPLQYMLALSAAVVGYEYLRLGGFLPPLPAGLGWPSLELNGHEPYGLMSFALSLLLVFRTNSSYSRWLDARKTWGLLLNRSRDFVRQGLTYIPESEPELRAMLCRWTAALPRALMCHLRKDGDLARELEGVLLPEEAEQVLLAKHRPNYVLQVLSEIVRAGAPPAPTSLAMDANLTAFADIVGTCERILKTPIPLSYTRHTSRFLMIWLTLLPFTLFKECGWTTVPLSGTIAFLLLGIDEVGVSIEEPFSILALEAICETALTNIKELQASHCGGGVAFDGSPIGAGAAAVTQKVALPAGVMVARRRPGAAVVPAAGAAGGGPAAGAHAAAAGDGQSVVTAPVAAAAAYGPSDN